MGDIEDYDVQLRDYAQLNPAQQARFREQAQHRASAERQKAIAAFFNACARRYRCWLRFCRSEVKKLKTKPATAPVSNDPT